MTPKMTWRKVRKNWIKNIRTAASKSQKKAAKKMKKQAEEMESSMESGASDQGIGEDVENIQTIIRKFGDCLI
jgi:hypothetical protein